MRPLFLLPLAGLLIGAAAPQANAPARHRNFCVSDFTLENPLPLPDGRVLFPSRPKGTSYAMSFKGGKCLGMRSDSRFIVEREGSQLCEGDRLRPFEPEDTIPGPVCVIDHIDPYTGPAPSGK